MDAKHLLSQNPLRPAYRRRPIEPSPPADGRRLGLGRAPDGGIVEIGHDGRGFAFDNEGPRHEVLLRPFALADRARHLRRVARRSWPTAATSGPELWLSDGWATVQAEGWEAPLYWEPDDDGDGWIGVHPRRAAGRSTRPSRSCTSATTRPTPTPAGPATASRPRQEWEAVAHPLGAEGLRRARSSIHRASLHPRRAGPAPPRRPAPPAVRRGVGVDGERLPALPRLPARRRARSVSTTASSWSNQHVLRGGCCATPRGSRPHDLPQLLPARRRAGPSAACASPPTAGPPMPPRRQPAPTAPVDGRRAPRPGRLVDAPRRGDARAACRTDRRGRRRCGSTTTAARSCSTRSPACPSTTRPGPSGRSSRPAPPRSPTLSGADTLVELGSGTSEKTRLLLDALAGAGTLRRFVPVRRLRGDAARRPPRPSPPSGPGLDVHAVVGDFHRHLGAAAPRRPAAARLPRRHDRQPRSRASAPVPLRRRRHARPRRPLPARHRPRQGPARLVAAYDDAAGVTAAFNRNALVVMNRELGADFDLDAYDHVAHWDEAEQRGSRCASSPGPTRSCGSPASTARGAASPPASGCAPRSAPSSPPTRVRDELWDAGLVVDQQWTDAAGDFLLTLAHPYC